ncbi:MAG: HAD-IIIA family hydrolase [Nitrospirota bacterium]|nr:HAD-IIIA family hydrolase [Nitrospirota bacterium]MDH5699631.1 HAD-IIIA family hydrolase [Nitrospirota bacterium]
MRDVSAAPGTAVFLDRDGTLNHDRGYVTSPEQLVLFPGVPEAIARLNHLGVMVLLVTNQSAIGRGMMTIEGLELIHERLAELIRPYGASIDGIFFCPHRPQDGCGCRKPKAGLIDQAVNRFALDLSQCYLVGDKRSDLEVAQTVSVPGVLVMTSSYSADVVKARDEGQLPIEYVADSFVDAVDWIEQQIVTRGNRIGLGR